MAILFGVGYGGIFPVYTVIVREHIPMAQAGRRTSYLGLRLRWTRPSMHRG